MQIKNKHFADSEFQTDSMKWSAWGKYLFVCISESDKSERAENISATIFVWNWIEERVIQKISRKEGHNYLKTNVFVLLGHPIHEEIFVSGEAGRVFFWIIGNDAPIWEFLVSGVNIEEPRLLC